MKLRQKALAFITVLLLAASNGFGALPAAMAAGSYDWPQQEFNNGDFQPYLHDKGYWGVKHDDHSDITMTDGTPIWDQDQHEGTYGDLNSPVLRYVSVKGGHDYYLYEISGGTAQQVFPSGVDPMYVITITYSGDYPSVSAELAPGQSPEGHGISHICVFFSGTLAPGRITIKKAFEGTGDPDHVFNFIVSSPGPGDTICTFSLTAGDPDGMTLKVPYGTYYIKELPEDGYGFVSFDVSPDDSGTEMIPPDTVKLVVEGGHSLVVEGIRPSHHDCYTVVCTNRQLGSLKVVKTDSKTGGAVPGATFHITGPGYDETLTTDASGFITLENLTPGDSYTVTETGAPDGYRINDADPHTQTIEAGGTAVFSFSDDPVGWIKIVKADADNHDKLLDGAVFEVADNAGFAGSITLPPTSDGHTTSPALIAGHWWVREVTPPAGYVKDDSVKEVDVAMGQTAAVAFYDPPDEGSLRVVKTSTATGDPVQGVTFELMDKDPSDPSFGPENILVSAQTGADGSIIFDHLATGRTYWVRETVPAPGYSIDAGLVKHAVIVFGQTVQFDFANDPLGYVKVIKSDSANGDLMLAGAVFGIFGEPGCTTLIQTMPATGADGTAVSLGLPYGPEYPSAYYIKEITAPAGYALSAVVHEVVFSSPGQVVEVPCTDVLDRGSIVIKKVDSLDTGKTLAGAEFKLYSDEALTMQVGDAVTTGADGIARFDGLASGPYWLKETKAPADYVLLAEPIPVTVTAGVTTPDIIVVKNNHDIHTGTADYTMVLAGGGVAAAGGLALLAAWLLKKKLKIK